MTAMKGQLYKLLGEFNYCFFKKVVFSCIRQFTEIQLQQITVVYGSTLEKIDNCSTDASARAVLADRGGTTRRTVQDRQVRMEYDRLRQNTVDVGYCSFLSLDCGRLLQVRYTIAADHC